MVFEPFDGAEFTDDAGRLREHRLPQGDIVIPTRIWSDEANLCWQFDFDNLSNPRKPDARMLHKFISLWDSPNAAIVKYAKYWGPLRYDERGQLVTSLSGTESFAYWRFLSRRAFSLLAVAADLKVNRPPTENYLRELSTPHEDPSFEAVTPEPKFFGFPNWTRRESDARGSQWGKKLDLMGQRIQIAGELSYWLRRFTPQLQARWNRRAGWHLEIGCHGRALPALALQLALMASGGDLYSCTACKIPYIRSGRRRPNAGQGNYCTKCGTGEALKRADERRRIKKQQAGQMYRSGRSEAEIASKLETTEETVIGWVIRGRKREQKTRSK